MYFETAAWEMEKPSFKSSPWIRGAPHNVFSRDIRRIRSRISLDTGGRPGFPRRDFHVQKSLNPFRCQPMTVSGLTVTREWRQPAHRYDRMTQKTLSAIRKRWPGPFPFQDSYLLAEGKDFHVERRAAGEDFAEDGDEDFDDLVHARKGIRW